MSDRFYPINSLSDILSKFRAELELALVDIRQRLDNLEQQVQQGVGTTELLDPELMKTKYGEYIYPEPEETTAEDWRAVYVEALAARRAIYGYAMLADSLGLPKDMKEHVRQLEAITSGAIRLMQTIKILEAVEAGTIWGPWGWLLAGGTLAATFVYTARAGGG